RRGVGGRRGGDRAGRSPAPARPTRAHHRRELADGGARVRAHGPGGARRRAHRGRSARGRRGIGPGGAPALRRARRADPGAGGTGEDLGAYPRDEQRDAALAAELGVDVLFAPPVEEVYPPGFDTAVSVGGLTDVLCGDPGRRGAEHFRGVATVVAKLLNMVGPDVAYFGQKDAQQALVIRKLVRDLDMPVRIEVL